MLKKSEKYTLAGTPASLIEQLDSIQKHDKLAEKYRGQSCGLGCLGFLISTMGLPQILPHGELGGYLLVAAMFGSVGVGVYNYYYWDRQDLDDVKLAVARRLLELLQLDLRDNVQAYLTLDFREARSSPFTYDTKGIKQYYRQTWLEVTTVLADATKLELQVTRQGRYREKVKRRGNKIRHVRADRISVALRVDPARYPDLSGVVLGDPPADLKDAGSRMGKNRVSASAFTPSAVYDTRSNTTDRPENLANPMRILGTLAWAYRGMKVAKTATAAGE